MESREFSPWDVVAICGVLAGVAYVLGSNSASQDNPQPAQIQAPEQPPTLQDEEIERVRRVHEEHLRETAAELQKLTLELQAVDASRRLENQTWAQQRADVQQEILDSQAKLRSEEEARESLEEKLKDTKDQLRGLEQDYKALERRFETELPSLRAGYQATTANPPSPRVMAQSLGYSDRLTPREAGREEWRRRFQQGQEARDAYNAWLAKERESDFLWATSLVHLDEGGTIDWPNLLRQATFVSHRHQAELALKSRDLEQLCKAADGALIVLESQARSHGRDTAAYLSAKRFLTVLRQFEL